MPATPHNSILFVPGKNPKPLPMEHRALLWRCLLNGVRLADPGVAAAMCLAPEDFHLAAWNGIYYRHIKAIEEDIPWLDALLQKSGPTEEDRRGARSWRMRRARLLYSLFDWLPALMALIPDAAVKSTILETERYFNNQQGIGDAVRELVKSPLRRMFSRGDRVLLIGHSMGSVIAYDALWQLWHEERNRGRVDLLVTLGSPLGMRFVQRRLIGFDDEPARRFPGNIRRWVNVAAQGDLTALDPALHDDFAGMREAGLVESITDIHDNLYTYFRNAAGLNVHRSYGYLTHPDVGRVIAAWWRGSEDVQSGGEIPGSTGLHLY
jgi:hypothetical protein